MITARDKEVIDFIQDFKIARTSTIKELFYPSLSVAQKRLTVLTAHKALKRTRDSVSSEYTYYMEKPRQTQHRLILGDFYAALTKQVEVVGFRTEYTIGSLRSDGLVGFRRGGRNYAAFVEVQISNTPLDVPKYEELFFSGEYKERFSTFPLIFAITDKQVPPTSLTVIRFEINSYALKF